MCQPKTVTAHNSELTGAVELKDAPQWIRDVVSEAVVPRSEIERRAEIDMRVGALLAKREIERNQYMRGFWDCFYILALIAWAGYLFWYWKQAE